MKNKNAKTIHNVFSYELFWNSRGGEIKNCGCFLKWHGITLAHIYAVLNVNNDLVLVYRRGLLVKHFQRELEKELFENVNNEDDRIRYFNEIDTPYRK